MQLNQIKETLELYSETELKQGAERYGLTLEQEYQRLRLMRTDDTAQWPVGLKQFIKDRRFKIISFNNLKSPIVHGLKSPPSLAYGKHTDNSIRQSITFVR